VVMSKGRIEQVGTADEIYDRPASPFVFGFIGESSLLPLSVGEGGILLDGEPTGLTAPGTTTRAATLGFRPHDAVPVGDGGPAIRGRIVGERRHGARRRLDLEVGSGRHRAEIDVAVEAPRPADGLVAFRPERWRLFPAD
ncbi:MAG: sulfate ABC transporter ATP-binding protein, partial [Rhizobiales bacterium]|nr:sulfate ABC transporter ATP-binding protein [Hyphomicrobiales bacterium]